VAVLGSRDQLCINTKVKEASSGVKTAMCKALVKKQSCIPYKEHEKYQNELKGQIMDIEDLVMFGESKQACPFYLCQKVQPEADIVFLPYNYLIDSKSRRSQNIDLANSVVIFDEGECF
jgi:regulator of telomere elongation helicase 1